MIISYTFNKSKKISNSYIIKIKHTKRCHNLLRLCGDALVKTNLKFLYMICNSEVTFVLAIILNTFYASSKFSWSKILCLYILRNYEASDHVVINMYKI